MNNPYRPLPPLGALIGFEAAARLGSFSLAAEELNMTQSAVSHQIRTLETHLQQPLFLRISRRVELTDAGRDLMVSAQEALETVRLGVRRLDAYSKPGSVVIHMPPAFGALWLAPRLARLRGSHPDVDPWLYTGSHDVDLTESEFDITLTTEAPIGEGFAAAPFLREERIALASPGLAADFQNRMGEAPLIHDEHPDDWQSWFLTAGLERADCAKGLNFSDTALAVDAATRGLGMCLCDRTLAQPLVRAGRLQVLSPVSLRGGGQYRLVTLERNLKRTAVRALWDWMLTETGGS
ncbi:LysR substrate-binding domain-containing protein [Leisingera sp. NJS204]|uniref:LysR substrate-binding domain-containing protein n=1 Tax=Leisingera sp. NJS204 TaxID=2508307 RepID=UPI001011ABE3|nr:LysR substrate-binding domain-containing protein [Leisingera sp. NJS204]QAX28798.1 LysR family transcriptional regulator [Leisingera sp. NJS204]